MPSKKKVNNNKNSKKLSMSKREKEIRLIGIDVDKVKKDYQLTKLSNKDIWKKYLKKKPQFSKYYPNDSFKSKKFNEPHMYLNKPIHREDLPCKWKCQRSWFQCHYAIDK